MQDMTTAELASKHEAWTSPLAAFFRACAEFAGFLGYEPGLSRC